MSTTFNRDMPYLCRRQPALTGEYSYIAIFSPISFYIFLPGMDMVERGRGWFNRVQPCSTGPYRICTVSRWDCSFGCLHILPNHDRLRRCTKILHFTLCLLLIPQIINGYRRGLQDTNVIMVAIFWIFVSIVIYKWGVKLFVFKQSCDFRSQQSIWFAF